jgi:cellulose synthase/poly-beta-1,6-N-acetylglucosamine synthase-like glycosyltransferase
VWLDALFSMANTATAGANPGTLSTNALPTVSFIIPCHNAAATLGAALASAAGQSYAGHIEISVYDDGSGDASVEVAREVAGKAGCGCCRRSG